MLLVFARFTSCVLLNNTAKLLFTCESSLYKSFLFSVSRDGQHSTRAEEYFHQDRLLPDPERRAAHWLHHHSDDHHVCRADQPGLDERETEERELKREKIKWAASGSAHSLLGWAGTWFLDQCFVQTILNVERKNKAFVCSGYQWHGMFTLCKEGKSSQSFDVWTVDNKFCQSSFCVKYLTFTVPHGCYNVC